MTQALIVSNILLWLAVLALLATVLALARQIGILYERIAPMGALMMDNGPGVGQPAPQFQLAALGGGAVQVGGAADRGTRNTRRSASARGWRTSPTCCPPNWE